jgi:MCP family monocarboxylic acid transporter-like MFS transporter 6
MVHLPNYVVHAGFSKDEASFMFTVIGIGTILSRLSIGLAIGPSGLDPLLLNFGLTAFMGGLIASFPLFITYSLGLMVFASLYGVYSGGLLVFTVPLCLEMAGMDKLTSALGLWFFLQGVGSFIGPPLAGNKFRIYTL